MSGDFQINQFNRQFAENAQSVASGISFRGRGQADRVVKGLTSPEGIALADFRKIMTDRKTANAVMSRVVNITGGTEYCNAGHIYFKSPAGDKVTAENHVARSCDNTISSFIKIFCEYVRDNVEKTRIRLKNKK